MPDPGPLMPDKNTAIAYPVSRICQVGAPLFIWFCTHFKNQLSAIHDLLMPYGWCLMAFPVQRTGLDVKIFVAEVVCPDDKGVTVLQLNFCKGKFGRANSIIIRSGSYRIESQCRKNIPG